MRAEIVGYKNINYKSKKTGEDVVAKEFYLAVEDNEVTEGVNVETIFYNEGKRGLVPNVKLGDSVELEYKKFGNNIYLDIVKFL